MQILIGIVIGIIIGLIIFGAKKSLERNHGNTLNPSASGLNEAEISILKSVIRDEVTQAAQTAMQASTDGTEKFFSAKTETLEE